MAAENHSCGDVIGFAEPEDDYSFFITASTSTIPEPGEKRGWKTCNEVEELDDARQRTINDDEEASNSQQDLGDSGYFSLPEENTAFPDFGTSSNMKLLPTPN